MTPAVGLSLTPGRIVRIANPWDGTQLANHRHGAPIKTMPAFAVKAVGPYILYRLDTGVPIRCAPVTA